MIKFLFEPGDVFKEEKISARGICDVEDEREQVPFVFASVLQSGLAEWLAREARNDAVHQSVKSFTREVLQITDPNRRWLQGLVFHPRQEAGRCCAFPLTEAQNTGPDSVGAEGGTDASVEHGAAAAQAEEMEDGRSHIQDAAPSGLNFATRARNIFAWREIGGAASILRQACMTVPASTPK